MSGIIVILRHAEAFSNVEAAAFADDSTNFLTPNGVHQAQRAADQLALSISRFDLIYTSTLCRSKQTARYIIETMGHKHIGAATPLLNEIRHDFIGMRTETEDRADQRAIEFMQHLNEVTSVFSNHNVLIVTHAMFMKHSLIKLFDKTIEIGHVQHVTPYGFLNKNGRHEYFPNLLEFQTLET